MREVTGTLEHRARQVRARAVVRRWEYRQRRFAKGSWYRLRRLLADAQECWVAPGQAREQLLARGYRPVPVGHELAPAKDIFVVPVAEVEAVAGARRIRVGLTAELLQAACVMLVLFEPASQR